MSSLVGLVIAIFLCIVFCGIVAFAILCIGVVKETFKKKENDDDAEEKENANDK